MKYLVIESYVCVVNNEIESATHVVHTGPIVDDSPEGIKAMRKYATAAFKAYKEEDRELHAGHPTYCHGYWQDWEESFFEDVHSEGWLLKELGHYKAPIKIEIGEMSHHHTLDLEDYYEHVIVLAAPLKGVE